MYKGRKKWTQELDSPLSSQKDPSTMIAKLDSRRPCALRRAPGRQAGRQANRQERPAKRESEPHRARPPYSRGYNMKPCPTQTTTTTTTTTRSTREKRAQRSRRPRRSRSGSEETSKAKPQRGAGRLSDARRAKLEGILEREQNKPRVCAHDPSLSYVLVDDSLHEVRQRKTEDVRVREFTEEREHDPTAESNMSMDAQDIALEANPTCCPIQILQKTAFFNGSRLLVESQFHDSVDRIEHNEPMALELWLLPVLDQDADRHLRTARVDLGFRNALLAVSAEQSTWRYVFCKGLATNNEQAVLPGTLERRASLRGTCPVVGQRRNCTPTLMLNSATGRLQVHLALASWTEERSPGGVLDFSTQTATESFKSTAQLRHGRWSHVALMLTGSHALLYINGQLDASYSARDTQRIAFNNYPLFVGSSPRATKEGSVAGEHGFVGFLHGVAMHTAVRDPTSFVNPDISRDTPPYPRPENEWGSILSSSIMTSNASIPGLGPDIQGQLRQARARQSLQRSWLDEQIREKAAQRESEEKRNEELAHEVLIQAQAWREEQQARRAQNSRFIDNISREMRTHMLEAMEQRRLTALQERLADVKLLGAFEDPSRIETARRQRVNNEYAQELRREADARQEARQQARDAELQAEKLRIQIQMESYRAEQLQNHRRYLQKQERLRQELADQILDKACASQYSAAGNDKFMSAEERALNARVLAMLASVPKCQ